MTLTAQTSNTLDAIIEANGTPDTWTMSEARAVWDACTAKTLFDGFEDFMCALIVRARLPQH